MIQPSSVSEMFTEPLATTLADVGQDLHCYSASSLALIGGHDLSPYMMLPAGSRNQLLCACLFPFR